MGIDQRKAEEYGQKILKQFQKDSTKLGPHELRLARKYYEATSEADNVDQNIRQINDQIYQAQARVRSLELHHKEKMGKAAAFLEYIISLKFDGDGEAPAPKEAKPKDNGARDPSGPTTKRKKKRSKKAAKKTQLSA